MLKLLEFGKQMDLLGLAQLELQEQQVLLELLELGQPLALLVASPRLDLELRLQLVAHRSSAP